MPIINSFISWIITKRLYQIDLFRNYPIPVQEETLENILSRSSETEFASQHQFKEISSYEDFRTHIPIRDYTGMKPFIQRVLDGENDILSPGEVKWFAKSSGTTSDKSKFIPVTREYMENCHFRGGKDTVVLYYSNYPDAGLFTGKGLVIGGSHQISNFNSDSFFGDLSAVLLQNMPTWGHIFRTPDLSIALMEEWEEKIARMAEITAQQNVTNISGVPSWTLVLLNRILEITGKSDLREVWPKLEVFFHGGVSFEPYRKQYEQLISGSMVYMETYNASEGFFGIQDDPKSKDMLLMLDYGIFYEFIPQNEINKEQPKAIPLADVKTGVNYAVVITTTGGLWRYLIGDTVEFTSLNPYKIKITGRTKHFINAFGEEIIIDNAETALQKACQNTGAAIREYTAGPVFMAEGNAGHHQWVIEFSTPPSNMEFFIESLDNALKAANSDYEAKRYKNMALHQPEIISVKETCFYNWMKNRNKLGGQHKVPRLSNNRTYIEEILAVNADL